MPAVFEYDIIYKAHMNIRMTKNTYKKTALVIIIMGTIAVFRIFLLDRYLSLDYIKESQQGFAVLYSEHRIAVIAAYMLIYIFVTGLSLPGATVMTLAGGALFGLWVGAIVISFASTLGATLACLISRFLLRDWVQSKFGDKLSEINQGIEKEGLFYLFTLRLIPAFPFFVINLLMGLTKMPIFTFYWISQIGMFPATLVYVNAGKELAKIDSLSGILSPPLIISFVILGLFPIAAKKAVAFYKSGRGGL